MTNQIITKYEEAKPKIKEQFNLLNELSLPKIEKVVINLGTADAGGNEDVLAKISEQIAIISGQKPKITRAKKAISSFKLRENDPIGMMVTLRGKKAWSFLERFIAVVMPRMRDFRGLPENKFDHMGNYSFGLTEQVLFPEVDYAKVDKIRGMVITVVIKNSSKEKSKLLLEEIGFRFRKDQ